VFGVLGAGFSNYATKLKFILRIDDALDIFAVHGIGGLVGNICTGFFAADYIAALDGTSRIDGGWLNQHWIQMGYQLADSLAGGVYSFCMTCLILFIMNLIPGLRLRASEDAEILGIDDAEIGEFAYDYVELTREVLNDVDNEAASRYSVDPTAFGNPAEKNSIPLLDARMFAGPSTSPGHLSELRGDERLVCFQQALCLLSSHIHLHFSTHYNPVQWTGSHHGLQANRLHLAHNGDFHLFYIFVMPFPVIH
jgi:Amt family ammonium transporter